MHSEALGPNPVSPFLTSDAGGDTPQKAIPVDHTSMPGKETDINSDPNFDMDTYVDFRMASDNVFSTDLPALNNSSDLTKPTLEFDDS
jgi:hypothetical protein